MSAVGSKAGDPYPPSFAAASAGQLSGDAHGIDHRAGLADFIAERILAWTLLLPIGVTGLWAGVSHVAFPAVAAAHIGWQVSPFQFEVGMADLAIGVTACLAFWQDHSFKAAAVCAASIFLLGDAVGHIREMVVAGNFAPGNAGLPFYMDIICPTLAIILVIITKHPRTATKL